MGNANAFYQGAKWYDDYQNQARQAKADAWGLEQQDRTRKDWAAQDQQRAGLASMIDAVGSTPNSDGVDPRTILGLAAVDKEPPLPSAYAQRQGFEAPVGADVQTPGLASMTPKNSPYFDAQTKVQQQRLAIAKALGGKEGAALALDTGDQMRKAKLQENSARLADTVMNLRPQEYQKLMETVTADSGNKYEATIDPDTGITTLKLGDSTAQLTRAQAAQYFAAKYRLKEGDPSAIGDLEKIDAGLAAKVATEFKSLRDTANDGNKAAYQNATLDVREKGLEQRERIGGGANGVSREERLRYTSLFQEAGRRAAETQRAILSLQKDPDFATGLRRNPEGPQAQDLAALRASLKSSNEERTLYQGMLAGSQTGSTISSGAPQSSSEKAMRAQATGDMGADPAAIDREIKQTTIDLQKVTDPNSKAQLTAYLADMQRQRANIGQTQGLASQTTSNKPNFSNLWK